MNFLNGMTIVRTLVPLLLLHVRYTFCWPYSNSLLRQFRVLDSGAINYITNNKSFFSSLSTFGYLPTITMANGFRVSAHGVDTIHLPSLSINNDLHVSWVSLYLIIH